MLLLLSIIITSRLFKASCSQISGSGNTTAVYGGVAYYRCASADVTGVRQVMWQKLHGDDSVENLATYSPHFGREVKAPYQGKVEFVEATLGSTAIAVKNVTWRDESCYVCSFNVFPGGSRGRQTCLTVQGISQVDASVQVRESAGQVVLRCSATGKPAPTVEWIVPPGERLSSTPEPTHTARNADHTFTSNGSITLQLRAPWEGHVDCVLNRGGPGQRTQRIPVVLQRSQSDHGTTHSARFGLVLCTCVWYWWS